jgi:hypothetical protein
MSRCTPYLRYATLSGVSELDAALTSKPVWYKMRECSFYPAWAHSVATALVALPHQAGE